MPDPALYDAVAERLRDGFSQFQAVPNKNEAAMRHCVVSPVLDAIGYSNPFRLPEQGAGRNRPDDLCYTTSDLTGHAALIVEAKSYAVPFDKSPGGLSTASPDRQIQRYLRQHPASGPHTIGVLTDGLRWRIYERAGPASIDVRHLGEYNFQGIAEGQGGMLSSAASLDSLREFVDSLCRECVAERRGAPPRRAPKPSLAGLLLDAFANGAPEPGELLPRLLGGRTADVHYDLADYLSLEGARLDAMEQDWDVYAYALGVPLQRVQSAQSAQQADQPALEPRRAAVAAVRFAPEAELTRANAALCARTFAQVGGAGAGVVLVYRQTDDGGAEARVAAHAGGAAAMTAPFDPGLPAASAKAAIEGVLGVLAGEREAVAPERLRAPLEVAPLRQQFYADVSAWVKRMAAGKDTVGREAVLRHLIRVMFAWILKEDGLIPAELFERGFAASRLPNLDDYHGEILGFLFYDRLNVEESARDPHRDPAIGDAMEAAPFLNGSLFQKQEGDDELDIPAIAYWGDGEKQPGLFTIFSRYHWTTDEHHPGESEQTLDPELLSNLFERLILPIEAEEARDKQPRGTYYTPADVVAEMVKDALAAAARSHAPAHVTDNQLLGLFGDRSAPPPDMTEQERRSLAERIHALRVFDPAVGSGAFLFGCLTALRTALEKLEPDEAEPTPRIIREQLHGQDIHPLAAQITRLRLFIALKAADRAAGRAAPLPNLEARIICADTLETSADPDRRPDRVGQLDTANPELVRALTAVAESRGQWMEAHTEAEKQQVLRLNSNRRDSLHLLLSDMGELASTELLNFAATPILPPPSHPSAEKFARTDARLLFYERDWRGFDVVIGNPPYEALRESMDAKRVRELEKEKRYRTTNCGDLYTLFCEAALALAKPEGGVVTMIVPLSIAFGNGQRKLRRVFEERCATISLRHHDNGPDTTFNDSPTVSSPRNRQRATIVTAIRGNASGAVVHTTGLQRWPADERHLCLAQRRMVRAPEQRANVDERISSQWPRVPTPEVAAMIEAVHAQERVIGKYRAPDGITLGFPASAMYYVSTIPAGVLSPRREKTFTVADETAMLLVMAALNGHVGYAWWVIFGDGFDISEREMITLAIPDAWVANPQPVIDLGRALRDAMPRCRVATLIHGTLWRNVDFHTYAPELIAEADRLYIEALGLPVDPLLSHLKAMRSNRSWDFDGGG